ncbi:Uncharacterized protein OS=Chthoniobacter flavus Ellin428 GN=CfE428DRAFT_5533 PE=4 SV=1 [Gemmata massiliana]|uniref:Uncharacterized protein n=1 Tax=Gemmata massiliana TaxID=1210884 RepID=A0A6P2CWS3_9BACT|nr:hypothetical protein [Gemmata massiliana]VTR92164.1 Uncharacterized protein OS=Chthoniobacter flavus Ellin428 GN=CfE428DRAFT_5533 PE=4 SV=1 [Gemmata massiliana]
MPANNLTATMTMEGDFQPRHSVQATDGVITQCSGTVSITKATAAALTIANPVAGRRDPLGGDDGQELTILSETAAAHTLSNAGGAGFNDGGTATDLATFGGAKGDNIVLIARNGRWWVKSRVNVTLS